MADASRIVTVDFTGVESGGASFVRVAEGDYVMKITAVKHKVSEAKKPNLFFTFKLVKGPDKGVGKSIGHNCSLQKQSLWNLRNLLEACGKEIPAKAIKLPLDKMTGWECAGTVVDDEYEGKKRSSISAFFPVADFAQTSKSGKELDTETETVEAEEETEEDTEELFS